MKARTAPSPQGGGAAYGPIHGCQVCGWEALRSVLFVGYLPPVNRMRALNATVDQEPWFPAEMLYCPACHLVQLGYAADPTILFPPDYPYTSGTTRILRENFAELYREARDRLGLSSTDLIVDVGSNDGTLLSNFAQGGHPVVGIEPSLTARLAEARGIRTLMTFLTRDAVERILDQYGPPRVVTATNVFAHIYHVHELMDNLERLVGPEGVFVSESHYLLDLVTTLQYDTIYHEHLRYYSVTSLNRLLQLSGFRIFHVKRIPTHGGSIRVYASKSAAFPLDRSVEEHVREEEKAGLTSERWIATFRERVERSKLDLYALLGQLNSDGGQIYGIGAPSRASTLIHYVGLDDGLLPCVLEVSTSKKLNKYMPGTRIPVLDEARLYKDQPRFALLLSWHIAEELCRTLKRRGYHGDFIVPLPSPRVIRNAEVPGD